MSTRWNKLGQLYQPQPLHPKLLSHAANPVAVPLGGDNYRVFYSGRDAQNRSSVGAVDIDLQQRSILHVHPAPFCEFGPEGGFDSHGISIGNAYEVQGQYYILYMGWHTPAGGHWVGEIGRLLLGADGTLTRESDQPFMPLDATDPISLSYPWVIQQGQEYRMWYGSTLAWDAGNGEMLHIIKHAVSADGHRWQRDGDGVPYAVGIAQAFSRPTVIANPEGGYDMWFSYRSGMGEPYRIGYVYSADGQSWELRLAQAGIEVSASGWDSEMICYPFVFQHRGTRYMLYNGNGYGATGFGLAVHEP